MKRTIASIAVSGILAASLIPAFACSKHNAPAKPATSKKVVSDVCPVMGSKIANVTKAAGKSVYKGKTYYFCCAGCKPKFDKNPGKYIKK